MLPEECMCIPTSEYHHGSGKFTAHALHVSLSALFDLHVLDALECQIAKREVAFCDYF